MVLLITGAIDLSCFKIPNTKLIDVQLRLQQYLNSILYAIEHYSKIKQIVFCENTLFRHDYSDLVERAQLKNKQLEILSFKGNYKEIQLRGKGYGEGEIISYALKNSRILKSCTFFLKLTGRVIVRNMDLVLTKTSFENAFDYHQGQVYNRAKNHIETLFFKTNKDFYLHELNDAYLGVNESGFIYLEHLFYDRLKKYPIVSFPIYPKLSGQSGTTGKRYDKNQLEKNLENFYYRAGIHKINRNIKEKIIAGLLITLLVSWRRLKKIVSR